MQRQNCGCTTTTQQSLKEHWQPTTQTQNSQVPENWHECSISQTRPIRKHLLRDSSQHRYRCQQKAGDGSRPAGNCPVKRGQSLGGRCCHITPKATGLVWQRGAFHTSPPTKTGPRWPAKVSGFSCGTKDATAQQRGQFPSQCETPLHQLSALRIRTASMQLGKPRCTK